MLQRVKELFRYLPGLEGDTRSRCCSQIVICAALVLFRSAYLYVSAVQPALFQGRPLISQWWHFFLILHPVLHQVVFCRCERVEFRAVDPRRGSELSVQRRRHGQSSAETRS